MLVLPSDERASYFDEAHARFPSDRIAAIAHTLIILATKTGHTLTPDLAMLWACRLLLADEVE